ncbi:phage antirepressor KilAC domain-containing protein [Clostridia bacterium]|nr:phage antirepressor KilAC domain-containing protein [Clostridia bacterium]
MKGWDFMNNQNSGINGSNTSQIQEFYSEEFGCLGILTIEGKPYFPAVECATALGYTKPHNAISRHCDHSLKRGVVSSTTNQYGTTTAQTVEKTFIPEGDLYRLIIRSKLPAAQRFEMWVFDTVLPSIRKHGAYILPDNLEEMIASPDFAIAVLTELQKERELNAELAPKARYYDHILQTKNALPVSLIAKDYGMSASKFNKMLHTLRIQYNVAGTWLLYQDYAGKGYTISRTYHFGEKSAAVHTCWTQKGRLFLYDFLAEFDVLPLAELLEDVILSGVFGGNDGEDSGDVFDNLDDDEDDDCCGCAVGARS